MKNGDRAIYINDAVMRHNGEKMDKFDAFIFIMFGIVVFLLFVLIGSEIYLIEKNLSSDCSYYNGENHE